MSDFLTSLVERNFGAAPVIRPRLNSLFEPLRGEAAQVRDTFVGTPQQMLQEEGIISDAPEQRQAEPRAVRMRAKHGEHGTTSPAEAVPEPSGLSPSPQLVRETERTVLTEKTIERNETRFVMAAPSYRDPTDCPPAGEITDRERDGRAIEHQPVLTPAARPPFLEKDKKGEMLSPKLPPQMLIQDLAPKKKPARQRDGESSLRSSAARPELSVQVTIGRIEVRASRENAHSSRPPSSSPVMSLDEYLRKRPLGERQ